VIESGIGANAVIEQFARFTTYLELQGVSFLFDLSHFRPSA
jgi:hypothetical protein